MHFSLAHFVETHGIELLVIYVILSNAVNSMPVPSDKSSTFYKWFFPFAHGLMIQAGRFFTKGADSNAIQNNHVNVDSPVVK